MSARPPAMPAALTVDRTEAVIEIGGDQNIQSDGSCSETLAGF
jgi:hypothetical protein